MVTDESTYLPYKKTALEEIAAVLKQWGVKSHHGEWTDEETQHNAAKDVLAAHAKALGATERVIVSMDEWERLKAAEEGMWSFLLWIGLEALEGIEIPVRQSIAEGGLSRWVELATAQGVLRSDAEDFEDPTEEGSSLEVETDAPTSATHVCHKDVRGEPQQCDSRALHGPHDYQAEFGAYFLTHCDGNNGSKA